MSSTTVWCPWVMNTLTCIPDSTSRSYFEFSNTRLASHPYKFICQKWHQKPSLGFCFWLNVCGRYGWLIAFVADSFWPKWAKGVIRVFGLQLPRAVDWLELSQSHGNQLNRTNQTETNRTEVFRISIHLGVCWYREAWFISRTDRQMGPISALYTPRSWCHQTEILIFSRPKSRSSTHDVELITYQHYLFLKLCNFIGSVKGNTTKRES